MWEECPRMRWTAKAIWAMQEGSKAYLVQQLEISHFLAVHANRVTFMRRAGWATKLVAHHDWQHWRAAGRDPRFDARSGQERLYQQSASRSIGTAAGESRRVAEVDVMLVLESILVNSRKYREDGQSFQQAVHRFWLKRALSALLTS